MKSNVKSNLIIIEILFALLPIITANLSYVTNNSNKSLDYSDDFTMMYHYSTSIKLLILLLTNITYGFVGADTMTYSRLASFLID